MEQKIGGIVALAVLGIVGLVLCLNLRSPEPTPVRPELIDRAGFREYPIGETERNQMQIAAVWLPPIQMEGMDLPQDTDVIHLEADIHATEGNINGFPFGAWIPYLGIEYEIIPTDPEKEAIRGPLMPMVAKDGPHYGATVRMPGAGKYRLVYNINPPSAIFGRHSDPITGVAPWWDPFSVEFDFDYSPAHPSTSSANSPDQ